MPTTVGGFGVSTSHVQCTAISKRSKQQCKGPAILNDPNQKCRMHGGASSTIGTRNSQYKTGRHSRYLPAKLDELYREALSNPDLIEMSDHIALLESRIQTILKDSEDEPMPSWADVRTSFEQIGAAVTSGDPVKIKDGVDYMNTVIEHGMKWDRTWMEVNSTLEQLRKLVDTEVKRKKELSQMVPIERVTLLVGAVSDAVKRNVTDPNVLQKIQREIAMLYGGNTQGHGIPRVGPEVVDVTPGGRSEPAIRRRKQSQIGSRA